MQNVEVALAGLAIVMAAMTVLWLLSLKLEDVSIVDAFWGPGFLLTACYVALTTAGGASFRVVSLFTVFWLQAGLLWVISAPLFAAVTSRGVLGALDLVGAVVFLTGIVLEAVADRQLKAFKADSANRGEVLDSGLWRYSRHPNYFGNAVLWWGAYLIALTAGTAWTVFSPVLMTFLLLKVSGVTLLERGMVERRPGYADYVRSTSAFVPWPPKTVSLGASNPSPDSGSSE